MKRQMLLIMTIALATGCGKKMSEQEIRETNEHYRLEYLTSKKWVGRVADQPVQLEFTDQRNADMTYTYYGKPGVLEKLSLETNGDMIVLKGVSFQRLAGYGGFYLDTLSGKLSADSATISGSVPVNGGVSAWSLSFNKTIADIDPPPDKDLLRNLLVKGKWEGRVENKPAKLSFLAKGDKNISAQMSYGTGKVNLSVTIQDDGSVILKAQPRPTAQGLMSESFGGSLSADFKIIAGDHSIVVTQGFTESESGGTWAVQDMTKK